MLYLDASAIVKLISREPETDELVEVVRGVRGRLKRTREDRGVRAAARVGGGTHVPPRPRRHRLGARRRRDPSGCGRPDAPFARTLDAIHLATARSLREDLDAVVAYDDRLPLGRRAPAGTHGPVARRPTSVAIGARPLAAAVPKLWDVSFDYDLVVDRRRPGRRTRRRPGRLLRQAGRDRRAGARAGRRRGAHRHAAVEDAARDRALPLGLPAARPLRRHRRARPGR